MAGHASVVVRAAPEVLLPGAPWPGNVEGDCDCNSPAHWSGETLYVFSSAGHPWRAAGPDLAHLGQRVRCEYDDEAPGGRWIESTWKAPDGALYGWYHLEPRCVCADRPHLTAPQIGAVRSQNEGLTWHNLGSVLADRPDALRCDTANHYFAGGHGDFCVVHDPAGDAFYFLYSAYGDPDQQGVAVARMAVGDRDGPVGKAWKWRDGRWDEPGLGGRATPIFRAAIDWHREDADAFWGPSVHHNSHLGGWVMLLNRAKDKDWTQEGIYVSFGADLSAPRHWTEPVRVLDPIRPDGWYPQVMGLERGGTDTEAGRVARLFVRGLSRWEIEFARTDAEAAR